jgi:hypothetical protein
MAAYTLIGTNLWLRNNRRIGHYWTKFGISLLVVSVVVIGPFVVIFSILGKLTHPERLVIIFTWTLSGLIYNFYWCIKEKRWLN